MRYNLAFCREKLRHRIAIDINPSYIPKSGKHTPGTGYFWSGCASAAKWGLEILGIALVDADDRDAVHLRAVQTVDIVSKGRPPKYLAGMDNTNSLLAWYINQEPTTTFTIDGVVLYNYVWFCYSLQCVTLVARLSTARLSAWLAKRLGPAQLTGSDTFLGWRDTAVTAVFLGLSWCT